MENNLLSIKNLTVHYEVDDRVVEAVRDISLEIGKGECLGLLGETGAGKTSTALAIMGLVPDPPGRIVSGEICFEGEDLLTKKTKDLRKIRGNKISMIFQDPMTSLNPVLRVGDQIMEALILHTKLSRAEAALKSQEMLELVGIPASRYDEYPHQFSGGMKQRVMIAIALACNPALLVADEPTTALDVTIQAQVLDMIVDLKKKLNTSLLMITHDLGVVNEVCDRVAVMYAGKIIEKGTIRSIYKNPKHPYTIGLFKSLPHIDGDDERLEPIPGMMPDPAELPKGCAFAPRCQYCTEKCLRECPELVKETEDHYVACFNSR